MASSNDELNEETCESDDKSICQFYLQGKCRFGDDCFNVHSGEVAEPTKNPKRAENIKHDVQTGRPSSKKPPLRTAGDVRKRIQWDSDMPEEYFYVGYLDRFDGVVEKPFLAFNWEHISLAGLDDLAIPQHRIHFFKYKDTKVWDKNERLDLVFGSANNEKSLFDVMKSVDERLANETYDNDSDDDNDNCIITSDIHSHQETKDQCIEEVRQRELDRATHFICIKIRNENLTTRIKAVQDDIISQEPVLRSCAMPEELLHVTLAMVKCESPNSVVNVCKLMNKLKPKLTETLGINEGDAISQQRIIKAEGLSTFGARVLYAKLDVPSTFLEIVNMIRDEVEKLEDTTITNNFDFVPHLTVMKVSRPIAKERRSKYINSVLYNDHLDEHFGSIKFDNLHFCSIEDNRGPDNFYITIRRTEV